MHLFWSVVVMNFYMWLLSHILNERKKYKEDAGLNQNLKENKGRKRKPKPIENKQKT